MYSIGYSLRAISVAPILKPIVSLQNFGFASSLIRSNRGIINSLLGIVFYQIYDKTGSYYGVMYVFLFISTIVLILSLILH